MTAPRFSTMTSTPRSHHRVVCLALAALLAVPLFADVVETKNGARLIGKVLRIADGSVALETDYAGTLAIKQSEVASLTTDSAIAVRLASGTRMDGKVTTAPGAPAGSIQVVGSDGTITTTVGKIASSWSAGGKDPEITALERHWAYEAAVAGDLDADGLPEIAINLDYQGAAVSSQFIMFSGSTWAGVTPLDEADLVVSASYSDGSTPDGVGFAMGDVDADGGDLAIRHPHAHVADAVVGPVAGAGDAGVVQRGDEAVLHRADVRHRRLDSHDRIADELAGAVVGQQAAAVDVDDLDALLLVPRRREREVAVAGPAAARVDGRVLEQQQEVRQLVGLAPRPHGLLEGERLAVGDRSEADDPQLGARGAGGAVSHPCPPPGGGARRRGSAPRRRRRAHGDPTTGPEPSSGESPACPHHRASRRPAA